MLSPTTLKSTKSFQKNSFFPTSEVKFYSDACNLVPLQCPFKKSSVSRKNTKSLVNFWEKPLKIADWSYIEGINTSLFSLFEDSSIFESIISKYKFMESPENQDVNGHSDRPGAGQTTHFLEEEDSINMDSDELRNEY